MQGKLVLGTIGAIIGAVLGAVAWAAITATTSFQIGYMAVGVGFLAGYGMRVASGQRERLNGIVAAMVGLLGCLLGNLFAIAALYAHAGHYPLAPVLRAVALHPKLASALLTADFSPMDLLFYAIAVYAGYRTALAPPRPVTAAAYPAHSTAPQSTTMPSTTPQQTPPPQSEPV